MESGHVSSTLEMSRTLRTHHDKKDALLVLKNAVKLHEVGAVARLRRGDDLVAACFDEQPLLDLLLHAQSCLLEDSRAYDPSCTLIVCHIRRAKRPAVKRLQKLDGPDARWVAGRGSAHGEPNVRGHARINRKSVRVLRRIRVWVRVWPFVYRHRQR